MLLAGVLFLSFLLLCWYYAKRLPSDYPPTPPLRVPYFGHLLYRLILKGSAHDLLAELYRRYSKNGMLALNFGTRENIVYIGDFKLVKEACKTEEINYRNQYPKSDGTDDHEGLIENYGKNWEEQRRFTLGALKDFGFGKSSMDDLISEEFEQFCTYLKLKAGESNGILTIDNFFNIAVLNVLWKIISDERFEYNDPQQQDLIESVFNICSAPKVALTSTLTPFLKLIYDSLGLSLPANQMCKKAENKRHIRSFLHETIQKHREDFDPSNIRDFIDSYLLAIQQTNDTNSSFFGQKGYDQLVYVLLDLFLVGSEPEASTLNWAVLFMIRNPNAQKKVRAEINEVLGSDHVPRLSDRERMPYTVATIMEIQRLGDIGPAALPHATKDKELKLGPYTIPKRHRVYVYLSNLLKSEEYWDEPLEFRPERHLGQNGKVDRKEHFIPYGIGKRQCLGEQLGRSQLFLFFTRLIQRFDLAPEDPNNLPTTDANIKTTSVPKPYKVRVTPLF